MFFWLYQVQKNKMELRNPLPLSGYLMYDIEHVQNTVVLPYNTTEKL